MVIDWAKPEKKIGEDEALQQQPKKRIAIRCPATFQQVAKDAFEDLVNIQLSKQVLSKALPDDDEVSRKNFSRVCLSGMARDVQNLPRRLRQLTEGYER
jgi:hypothetical protein